METQITFTDIEFEGIRKITRLEKTLNMMEDKMPIDEWCEIVRPFYYVAGNGRQPTPLKIIMRMYLLSHWQNMSDEICEDMLCRDTVCRRFVGVTGNPPDATVLGKFRNLLEEHKLNKKIFESETKKLKEHGIIFQQGTIIDSTIVNAADSWKNKKKESNPEFSSTQKGTNRYRGAKMHTGTDPKSGLVHSMATTTAKESDVTNAHKCIHGSETVVRGDAGYIGIEKRTEICEKFACKSGEMEKIERRVPNSDRKKCYREKVLVHKKRAGIKFVVNRKRSQLSVRDNHRKHEKAKSQKRWRGENPFLIIKHIFGYRRTRQPTLAKTDNKNYIMVVLANCYMCSQRGLSTKRDRLSTRLVA